MDAPQWIQVQNGSATYTDCGTNPDNAYMANYTPAITAYTDGMVLRFWGNGSNTGPATFNAGAGAYPIYGLNDTPLQGNEIAGSDEATVQWNAGQQVWILIAGGYAQQVGPASYSYQAPQWFQVFAGDNAAWNNEYANRALGTTYTNSYGKPISVMGQVQVTAAVNINPTVNGVDLLNIYTGTSTGGWILFPNFYFVVPTGATYSVYAPSGCTLEQWLELY